MENINIDWLTRLFTYSSIQVKFIATFAAILIFIIIALTNKLHIFNTLVFNYELPKIFYGILSTVRASVRLVWPIYYLIFIFSGFSVSAAAII